MRAPKALPNWLTIARIVLIPALVALFFVPGPGGSAALAAVFVIASITDWLDGYFARKLQVVSRLGTFLDPIADKLMVAAALVMLAGDGRLGLAGSVAAVIILLRELFIAGLREYLAGAEINVPVSQLAKWKTAAQMVAITVLLLAPALGVAAALAHMTGLILLWLAAAMTAVTGWQYWQGALPVLRTPSR
ncbi:MAG: CDP-diacylglycerol--glycerol-3-phosphate 3-phosphatidyltransferase [Rhodothalassiaceae bacterium]